PEADPAPPAAAQPLLHRRVGRRQHRDEHLARDTAPAGLALGVIVVRAAHRGGRDGILAVDLAQELLDKLARGNVLHPVHHPPPPPAARVPGGPGGRTPARPPRAGPRPGRSLQRPPRRRARPPASPAPAPAPRCRPAAARPARTPRPRRRRASPLRAVW